MVTCRTYNSETWVLGPSCFNCFLLKDLNLIILITAPVLYYIKSHNTFINTLKIEIKCKNILNVVNYKKMYHDMWISS